MTYKHQYSTWSEFVKAVTEAVPKQHLIAAAHEGCSWTDQPNKWSGTFDYKEAIKYLHKGWEYGLFRIDDLRKGLDPLLFDRIMPTLDYKPELQHQIAGGTIDMGSYISGTTPLNYIAEAPPSPDTKSPIQSGKKLQTIYMYLTNSCNQSEDAFFYRGAYTYLLVEHLENCGYSVEVVGVSGTQHGTDTQLIYVKIKEFGELFDNNKLCVALCSAFMLRRYIFRLQESASNTEVTEWCNDGYGYPHLGGNPLEKVILPEDKTQANTPLWINTVNTSTKERAEEHFKGIVQAFVDRSGEQQTGAENE